jgi:chorismate synthase
MGSQHNDPITPDGFATNHAGGILGGISTGAEIVFRVVVKPTSSIGSQQHTIDASGRETTIEIKGRHDPCICPRIVPVIEAMAAIVLEDHCKRQAALHA